MGAFASGLRGLLTCLPTRVQGANASPVCKALACCSKNAPNNPAMLAPTCEYDVHHSPGPFAVHFSVLGLVVQGEGTGFPLSSISCLLFSVVVVTLGKLSDGINKAESGESDDITKGLIIGLLRWTYCQTSGKL